MRGTPGGGSGPPLRRAARKGAPSGAASALERAAWGIHYAKIGRMRILVIEDDEDLADAIVRRLRRLGHAVDWQNDGLSADGVLQYESFDLVILDIGLPRMSGFDILHRLRDRGSKIPVLALTARIDIEDRVHALDTGADDYLAKPFDFRELERAAAPVAGPARRPPACSVSAIWSSTAPRACSRWPASASSCPSANTACWRSCWPA